MKRVRQSKTREQNYRNTWSALIEAYRNAVKTHEPHMVTFQKCLERIKATDVITSDQARLFDAHYTLREYHVRSYARWQLYLDGQPVTSEQISARRDAGDENVWHRVCGRHEWADSHDPFYDNDPPHILWSEPHKVSEPKEYA